MYELLFVGLTLAFVLLTVYFAFLNAGKEIQQARSTYFAAIASAILAGASLIALFYAIDAASDKRASEWVKACTDRGGSVFEIDLERSCLKPGFEVIHF